MIITTNRYVVNAEYAAQNQEHIRRVMEELRALRRTDLKYSVFYKDGEKNVHPLAILRQRRGEKGV